MEKTCLHRILQTFEECKTCKRDYNPKHYPNNLDCSNYCEEDVITKEPEEYSLLNKSLTERIFQE